MILGHSRVMIWNVFLLFVGEIVFVPFLFWFVFQILFWFVAVFATRIMQKYTTGIYMKQGTDGAWNTEGPPDLGGIVKISFLLLKVCQFCSVFLNGFSFYWAFFILKEKHMKEQMNEE